MIQDLQLPQSMFSPKAPFLSGATCFSALEFHKGLPAMVPHQSSGQEAVREWCGRCFLPELRSVELYSSHRVLLSCSLCVDSLGPVSFHSLWSGGEERDATT